MANIDDIAKAIGDWRRSKGFYSPDARNLDQPCRIILSEADAMLGKLALLHSEVSEAIEAIRKSDLDNFREEIADCAIRILDITEASGIDLEAEIEKKMSKNRQRVFKHGKVTNL